MNAPEASPPAQARQASAWRPWIAEAVGTGLITFAGIAASHLAPSALASALASAAAAFLAIAAFATVSGAHFNPVVTLAFAATGRVAWRSVPAYLVAQLVGATLAVTLLERAGVSAALVPPAWSHAVPVAVGEAVGAAVLLGSIAVAIHHHGKPGASTPLAATIAVGLACAILAVAPLGSGILNPAKSFAMLGAGATGVAGLPRGAGALWLVVNALAPLVGAWSGWVGTRWMLRTPATEPEAAPVPATAAEAAP